MLRDHRRDAIREARERTRQREALEQYGHYIENRLRWDWFVTITFARRPSSSFAVSAIRRFLYELEVAAGRPIGWVLVLDYGAEGGRLHAHLLVAGVHHLDLDSWWRSAERRFGSSAFSEYAEEGGAAHYLAQHVLTQTGDLHMGGGLIDAGSR